MRKLTPERRRAAILCGACAAVIPSISLMMRDAHSNTIDFAGGMIIGLMITMSFAAVIRVRRSCS